MNCKRLQNPRLELLNYVENKGLNS